MFVNDKALYKLYLKEIYDILQSCSGRMGGSVEFIVLVWFYRIFSALWPEEVWSLSCSLKTRIYYFMGESENKN